MNIKHDVVYDTHDEVFNIISTLEFTANTKVKASHYLADETTPARIQLQNTQTIYTQLFREPSIATAHLYQRTLVLAQSLESERPDLADEIRNMACSVREIQALMRAPK
jgi:hypothetical protein